DDQRARREHAQVLEVLPSQVGKVLVIVDAAVLTGGAENEKRQKDSVESDNRAPEVDLAPEVVHLSTEHLREPIVDRSKGGDDRDRHERVVEVGQHEIGVVQIDIGTAG